ncbi:MAG: quinone-dependent dihydroorotate dehydrogenase [Propionibacteriaceae bacterium]|nr:quinone-dependent dihydroorotate dehydrogenase [Propionibacteriaceae bacterium]
MISWDEASTRLLLQGYTRLLRPVLYQVDAETIHKATIDVLGRLPGPALAVLKGIVGAARQPVTVAGIDFPGRVGLAAGQDKDGVAARAWASLGFGFAELGTVTAQAQPGNPAPRLFRVPELKAFINRMGFNNAGAAALATRLEALGVERCNGRLGLPIGVSIGKTKVVPVEDAIADYLASFDAVAPFADYVAVNVSSPNTPGLRNLQAADELARLTSALTDRAAQLAANPVPIFVKVAPDLSDDALLEVVRVCESTGVSGLIAVNTTTSRPLPELLDPALAPVLSQDGGLSGGPLTSTARQTVTLLAGATRLPIIASGGIMTPGDAQALFDVGAVLVQVLSGFIYSGPALTRGINRLTVADRRHHG